MLAFSGIMFLAPIASPVHAANTTKAAIGISPYATYYAGGDSRDANFNFTNPASNTLAIVQLVITFPSGWGTNNYCGRYGSSPYPLDTCSAQLSSVKFTMTSAGTGLAPGETQNLEIRPAFPSGSTYPICGTFTTQVEDSSGVYAAGPSFQLCSFNPNTSDTFTPPTSTSFTAGSGSQSYSLNLGIAEAGIPVIWQGYSSTQSSVGSFSGATCQSDGICWALTNSAGTVSVSYTPPTKAGSYTVGAAYGMQNVYCDNNYYTLAMPIGFACGQYWDAFSFSFNVVAAAPSAVSIHSNTANTANNGADYSTSMAPTTSLTTNINGAEFAASTIQFALKDAFGNVVDLSTLSSWSVTLTANAGGAFDASTTGASLIKTLTCASGQTDWETASTVPTVAVACPSGAPSGGFNLPYNYFNGLTYGNTTSVTLSITGTGFPAKAAISNSLITSTFSTGTSTAPVPATTSVQAGKTVQVVVTLSTPQKGVPVTINLDTATSFETTSGAKDYSSTGFTGGTATSITNSTDKNGVVKVVFAVDTVASATAYFNDTVAAPSNTAGLTGVLTTSADSAGVVTGAGTVASFILKAYYVGGSPPTVSTTKSVNGSTLYVDAILADKYGNKETTCTQSQQIQVNLAVSGVGGGGLLSATSVYIAPGQCDTAAAGSYGPIEWSMPVSSLGSVTVTANAVISGNSVTGVDTITVSSPVPSMAVTSPAPLNGVIYSNSAFTSFSGWAAVSAGYLQSPSNCGGTPAYDCITSIKYTTGAGASGSTIFSAANNASWSIAVPMPAGLSTIKFNATDANGFTVTTASYTVLVDTSAPNVNFVTANNANISSPATVSANLVDSMGDLNASSVSAVATNVQSSATKTLTSKITGANNPGHSVTYGVTVSGLTTGNWTIVLNAADLAGNTNSSTITVHVTVPFAQSFVISGTPHSATVGSFAGINASYTNQNPTSQSVVVFAVFKNSAGQTMGIGTGSLTIGAGATQSVFIANPVGLASGTYTVNIFVFTTGNLPVSVTTTISVTV